MRTVLEGLLRLLLGVFFRRVEVSGRAPEGAVVYALNHPSALVDPTFILCFAPQRVAFLAKEPVFRMPLIGALVRAFDSLPVYRRQDGADPADNRRTLDAAAALLDRGGAIALFPEGTSHSDPRMRRLKTGAARIALAANARRGADQPSVPVVPVGLTYSAKGTFRSRALVSFGAPIEVARVELDAALEPPSEAVVALTDEIERALAGQTLQADSAEALEVAIRAERIYAAGDGSGERVESATPMADALVRRQRFVAGYARLERERPALLGRLVARMARYEDTLAALGLDPQNPERHEIGWRRALRFSLTSVLVLALLMPLALIGVVVHAPAYQTIRFLAFRFGHEADRLATIKLLGALLLFPLSWLIAAGVAWWLAGPLAAVVTGALAPPSGYAALLAGHRLARVGAALQALVVLATRGRLLGYLTRERAAIRAQFAALGEELERAG